MYPIFMPLLIQNGEIVTATGRQFADILCEGETIQAIIDTREFPGKRYLFFVTKQGQVKKTAFDEYDSSRRDGLIAVKLRPKDELTRVIETHGTHDVFIISRDGLTIRFSEKQVRPMGRSAAGVRGMRLRASDEVENIDIAVDDYLAQLGENFMDLTILGLGPDGHVASLFPGAAHIDRLEKVIAITDSPKPPSIRATFTLSMINTSTLVWIIAAGASKADAVTKIIEGDLSIPASYVRAADHTRLIVDTDAFFTE